MSKGAGRFVWKVFTSEQIGRLFIKLRQTSILSFQMWWHDGRKGAGAAGLHNTCNLHLSISSFSTGYVSDPMSTMRFHSRSNSGSFEDSGWQQEQSTWRESLHELAGTILIVSPQLRVIIRYIKELTLACLCTDRSLFRHKLFFNLAFPYQ